MLSLASQRTDTNSIVHRGQRTTPWRLGGSLSPLRRASRNHGTRHFHNSFLLAPAAALSQRINQHATERPVPKLTWSCLVFSLAVLVRLVVSVQVCRGHRFRYKSAVPSAGCVSHEIHRTLGDDILVPLECCVDMVALPPFRPIVIRDVAPMTMTMKTLH